MRRFALVLLFLAGCAGEETEAPLALGDAPEVVEKASMTRAERLGRAKLIREAAARRGLTNASLLAGIAEAETNLAHCHDELPWACRGPYSADCGGPVVAGAGDGTRSRRQGGLGMFQFDGGDFEQTIAREGRRVLTIAGNVDAAVDFVLGMVMQSEYVSGVSDEASALRWINEVRIDGAGYGPWIKTVTAYYNGCRPNYGCYRSRYAHYDRATRAIAAEFGPDFWQSKPLAPMAIRWARGDDGTYAVGAIAPDAVVRVEYAVDDYLIGEAERGEGDFPIWYVFNHERNGRRFEATGFDARGDAVARGVGLIDVTPGAAVYVRQLGDGLFEVGLERAPTEVAAIEVEVDGHVLTDDVEGATRSRRLAVRQRLENRGARTFRVTTFDADGHVRGTLTRHLTLP